MGNSRRRAVDSGQLLWERCRLLWDARTARRCIQMLERRWPEERSAELDRLLAHLRYRAKLLLDAGDPRA